MLLWVRINWVSLTRTEWMVGYGVDIDQGNVLGQRGHGCEGCWCIRRKRQQWP